VFLNRRPGPAQVLPCATEKAIQYLAQYDTRPDRAYAEDRYRSLLREGACIMEYDDVWDGVRCLETL
jgi:hypothetical protein